MCTQRESLARKMNSAQNMNPAIGFNATLTFITYPDKDGKGPATNNPGRLPFKMMHKKKDEQRRLMLCPGHRPDERVRGWRPSEAVR